MNALKRWWKLVPLAAAVLVAAALVATTATARSSASTIKIAVLSDCQGAFGSFDNQDLAGVVTAMAQFAGAKAKNPNKPRDGWTGASIITSMAPTGPSTRSRPVCNSAGAMAASMRSISREPSRAPAPR